MANRRKLGDKAVVHIRQEAMSVEAYGRLYGINHSNVRNIQRWKSYADIRGPNDPITVGWLIRALSQHPPSGIIDESTLSIDVIGDLVQTPKEGEEGRDVE
jgi:hypothetical protein